MNLAEAQAAHKAAQDLKTELWARVPKTIQLPDWREEGEFDTFELYHIDPIELLASYRMYLCRGEYEYAAAQPIILTELFKD
jgi:hypothetical protein